MSKRGPPISLEQLAKRCIVQNMCNDDLFALKAVVKEECKRRKEEFAAQAAKLKHYMNEYLQQLTNHECSGLSIKVYYRCTPPYTYAIEIKAIDASVIFDNWWYPRIQISRNCDGNIVYSIRIDGWIKQNLPPGVLCPMYRNFKWENYVERVRAKFPWFSKYFEPEEKVRQLMQDALDYAQTQLDQEGCNNDNE